MLYTPEKRSFCCCCSSPSVSPHECMHFRAANFSPTVLSSMCFDRNLPLPLPFPQAGSKYYTKKFICPVKRRTPVKKPPCLISKKKVSSNSNSNSSRTQETFDSGRHQSALCVIPVAVLTKPLQRQKRPMDLCISERASERYVGGISSS